MSVPFKVHELLKEHPSDREALEVLAREPGRTGDECMQWLLERGYAVSRTAVYNWLGDFREQLMRERFSQSGELAAAIRDAGKRGGAVAISEAAMLQLSQVIFEQSAMLQQDGEIDTRDIRRLTASIKSLMDSTQRAEQIKAEYETKQREAIAAAQKVAESGGDGQDVIGKVREILGLAA